MLPELDDRGGGEQEERARRPAEEHDRGNGEDERQRDDAPALLRVDRNGEAFGKRRGSGKRSEAHKRAGAVTGRREDVTGSGENSKARQADGEDEGGKPAGRDRLGAHVSLEPSELDERVPGELARDGRNEDQDRNEADRFGLPLQHPFVPPQPRRQT